MQACQFDIKAHSYFKTYSDAIAHFMFGIYFASMTEGNGLMQKKNWVVAGIYLGALLLGWGGSFAVSQWTARETTIPEGYQAEQIVKGSAKTGEQSKKQKSNSSSSALPKAMSLDSYLRPIVSRSIFDSTKVNAKTPDSTSTDDNTSALTDLDLRLLATIVAEPAEFSVALILDNKANQSQPYAVGDKLIEDAIVHEIKQKEVIIKRSDGTLERLTTAKEEKATKSKSKTDTKSKSNDEGITKDGNKYVVDQEVFDELLKNPEKLYSQIRAVPHKDSNGEIDGYRLSGIRRKSVFYKLGVKNGDIVHSVNGRSLNSMSSALDAFNSLQSSREFSFDLTRRRKQQTMEYEVR